MTERPEPKEAFLYKPPDEFVKNKYKHIFELDRPLRDRLSKLIFDKVLSLIFLVLVSPILLLVKVAYLIEGWLIPENTPWHLPFTPHQLMS